MSLPKWLPGVVYWFSLFPAVREGACFTKRHRIDRPSLFSIFADMRDENVFLICISLRVNTWKSYFFSYEFPHSCLYPPWPPFFCCCSPDIIVQVICEQRSNSGAR